MQVQLLSTAPISLCLPCLSFLLASSWNGSDPGVVLLSPSGQNFTQLPPIFPLKTERTAFTAHAPCRRIQRQHDSKAICSNSTCRSLRSQSQRIVSCLYHHRESNVSCTLLGIENVIEATWNGHRFARCLEWLRTSLRFTCLQQCRVTCQGRGPNDDP